jgi:hypothetical protein
MEYKHYVIPSKAKFCKSHFLHLQNVGHFAFRRSGIIVDLSSYTLCSEGYINNYKLHHFDLFIFWKFDLHHFAFHAVWGSHSVVKQTADKKYSSFQASATAYFEVFALLGCYAAYVGI